MSESSTAAAAPAANESGGAVSIAPLAPEKPTSPAQLISFAIGDDHYGVDIMAVREIRGWTEITPLPRQPVYIRGVVNLRGVVVPIVDLRCRFGQGLTEAGPLHIVIIVQISEKPVGLLADRVLDIVTLDAAQIRPVPRVAETLRSAGFLSGLVTTEDTMIALIDLPNLLSARLDDGDAGSLRPASPGGLPRPN
jgi:purine-binding chemotaxis protein CheW